VKGYAVHSLAFNRPNEANLVDALRGQITPFISLVAAREEYVANGRTFGKRVLSS